MERCCASNIGVNGTGLIYSKILFHFKLSACGALVDEAALITVLQEGRIAGAGLDVYAREPLVPQALRDLENVVLLPHLGTAALEVREAMGQMAIDNLIAWGEGAALPNLVN